MTERKYRTMVDGKYVGIRFGRTEKKYNTAERSYDVLEECGYTVYMTKEAGTLRISAKGCNVYARANKSTGLIDLTYRCDVKGQSENTATCSKDIAKGKFSAAKKYLLNTFNFKDMKFETLYDNFVEALRDKYEADMKKASEEATAEVAC